MRYQTRSSDQGWTVWDAKENAPAVVNGGRQTMLLTGDAEDMVDMLNGRWGKQPKSGESNPAPEEDLGGGDICSLQDQPSTEDDAPLD